MNKFTEENISHSIFVTAEETSISYLNIPKTPIFNICVPQINLYMLILLPQRPKSGMLWQ